MDHIELIKSKLLPSNIVGKKVKLIKKGVNFVGLCPFHHEKTPSFTVNDSKGFYYCFGCGASGDIFEFICKTEGLNFKEAVAALAQIAGVQLLEKNSDQDDAIIKTLNLAANWFAKQLHHNKSALSYLEHRQISADIVKKFRIGYAPNKGLKEYLNSQGIKDDIVIKAGLINKSYCSDYFKNRLIFPIWNAAGRVIAFGGRVVNNEGQPKYLNSSESILFKKRENIYPINFALSEIRKKQQVFVVEGYMDVIALFQAGITNVIAPLGTAISDWHIKSLWSMAKEISICMDGDNAGYAAALRVAELVLPILEPGQIIKFIILPTNQDPYDICSDYIFNTTKILSFFESKAKLHSEFLWDHGLSKSPFFKTNSIAPERYAILENDLMKYVNSIENSSTKKYYKSFFYNKIRLLQNSTFVCRKAIEKINLKMTKEEYLYNKAPDLVEQEQNQMIVVRIVMEFPEILDDSVFFEQFASFDMTNKDIYILQQHIINIKNNLIDALPKDLLIKELEKLGITKITNHVLKETKLLCNQLNNRKSAEIVWHDVILLQELNTLKAEELQARLNGNFDHQSQLIQQIEAITTKRQVVQMQLIKEKS